MHPKLYGQSNRLYRRHRYQKNHGRAAHPTAIGSHESSFSPSVPRRLSTLPAFITPRLRRSLPPSATLSRTFSHGSMPTARRPSLNSRRTEPTRNLRFPGPPPSVTAWTYRCRSPPESQRTRRVRGSDLLRSGPGMRLTSMSSQHREQLKQKNS